jgi:antitoxin CptB
MTETAETMRRRLAMRSMRRGIREMDLILSDFAARALPGMGPADLALYDSLLSENDHDLYVWIAGQAVAPERYASLVARIAEGAARVAMPRD